MARVKSWAEMKAKQKNTEVPVRVTLAGDLWAEWALLVDEYEAAKESDEQESPNRSAGERDKAPVLAARIEKLRLQMKDSEVEFVFRGIGRSQYARLLADHPPTDEQQKEADRQNAGKLLYNPDTYPKALMAASCVKPAELAGNLDEWAEIHDSWNPGQVGALWGACLQAQQRSVETPFSLAALEAQGRQS